MARKDKQSRTIVLPIVEGDYAGFLNDPNVAHAYIQDFMNTSPELFPADILEKGYSLYGKDRPSKKLGIRLRRLKVNGQVYRIRPSFVLPYMRGRTQEVSHAMLLMRYGVPFWVLAVVFGRNAMYWYRLFICLSDFDLVGTTVYEPSKLPQDILADEFHTRIRGVKAYVATVIAKSCMLGMALSAKADEWSLRKAYSTFKTEAQRLITHYQPRTINTDGWAATQKALKTLFPKATIVECFLHAFIKVRDRATKKLQAYYEVAADKIWDVYRAKTKAQMAQRIRRLKEWVLKSLPSSAMKDNLLKLCAKKNKWIAHFANQSAYRTSAQLDRIMKNMERHAYNSQMFHSDLEATTRNFRAFALIHNFAPSCPIVCKDHGILTSPAARLNGFIYHEHWLENLFVAASLHGQKYQRNPL